MLEVFGPAGISAMTDHILAAYEQDIRIRIDGLEPANDMGYRVNAHEVEAGPIYADPNVIVTAFSVNHVSWPNAFGYKFVADDKTIVISGDARPSESIVEQCNGCDILIHEVYSQAGFDTRPPEWQRYHASFHTSSYELAEIASRARPQLLILYHQNLMGQSEEQLLAEIREQYDGRVVWGRDLQVY